METWTIILGEREFTVPRLPLKVTRVVYPICQRLTNAELTKRIWNAREEPLQTTDEEMDDLCKITLLACQVADPSFTKEEFEDLPVEPGQLYDAFLAIRFACGGWATVKVTEGQDQPGEEPAAARKKPKK